MVVAFGAPEGRAEPGGGDGADAFGTVLGQVFLGLGTALAGHHVQAVVAGGDLLLLGRAGEEVARQLLAREGVERLVGVERVDHVVAVREDPLVLVAVEADRVREAGDIEPPHRHALAVVRRGQQAIDLLLVGVRSGIREERGELGGRGRQAGEVEGEAAQQAFLGSLGRGCDPLLGELRADEGVDGVAAPGGHGGDRGGLQRDVGPVGLVRRTLGDPPTEEFLLRVRQRLVGLLLRHQVVLILRIETLDDLGLVGFTRHDGERAALAGLQRLLAKVQAQSALA